MNYLSRGLAKHGIERRRYVRYRPAEPLAGYIEHQSLRYAGHIIDVSATGFCLLVPGIDGTDFVFPGITDWGEIAIKGELIGGFGRGVYVRPVAKGVLVGFEWDEYVFETHWRTLTALIGDLRNQCNTGCASMIDLRMGDVTETVRQQQMGMA